MQQLFQTHHCRRLAAALTVALLATGCATLDGDPYYDGGYAGPAYYPANPPIAVYDQPAVIYTAPPPGWRAEAWREHQIREARERDRRRDWERREAERQRAQDRQRDAERRELERRREAERRDWERRREAERRNVPNDRQRELWQREQRLLNHPDPDVVRARREQFERDRQAERESQRGTPPWPR
ncbi:hypothetical protein SAMN05428957_10786 [Oryzisolibacter propanilivorax]|uniref:Uncharacterized protein n=1 Tax=Oryzisolibacter propanilivorax TaxID=1527607 RepID=A0A1G9TZJ0_9BURK|nr:hypothetical protein [Oryzisolibacter propanilivorax]SDM53003.1 hypothetical protein SAMN05428957_10786 [Oryzisolibacter propanilivorax]